MENGKMIKDKEEVFYILIPVKYMKVNLKKIFLMVLEYLIIQEEKNISVNLKIIKEMDMV